MENILEKLHNFIRKYHTILLLRNLFFFSVIIALIVAFFALIEYTLWLDTLLREIVFIISVTTIFFIGLRTLLLPFLKISRYNKKISSKEAADIIGKYFPEIQDKFRNFLELKDLLNVSRENNDLLLAAITQKTDSLRPYKFAKAINYSDIKKWGLFVSVISIAFLFLTFKTPDILFNPLERIIKFNTEYVKPAPFDFILKTKIFSGNKGDEAKFEVALTGSKLPSSVFIEINGNRFPMSRVTNSEFLYSIQQLKENFTFRFFANGYFSKDYQFKVLSKPLILNFQTEIIYPQYLEKQNEIISNTTDYLIPEGTRLQWALIGKDVDSLNFIYNNKNFVLGKQKLTQNAFSYTNIFRSGGTLHIIPINSQSKSNDTLTMNIDVIPDAYPEISVNELSDSVMINKTYFKGEISDDYGFHELRFYIRDDAKKPFVQTILPISKNIISQEYYYMFDFSIIDNWRSKNIEYYFEISDNDALNGFKKTKTNIRTFTLPDKQTLAQNYSQKQDNIEKQISSTISDVQSLQNDIKQMKMDMLNKKNLSWEDKNKLQQLMEKQKEIEDKIEQIKEQNTDKNIFEEMMKDITPELLEKQRQLEELFNQVFDDEMKEMLQKIQDLMMELNKDKIMEQLDKMQLRTEDISKEMDRNMELLKQLEFEKKMTDVIDNLNKTKENLDELSTKTEQNKDSKDKLLEEQKKLNDDFQKIKEDINKLEEQNKNLFEPIDFPETSELEREIEQSLNEAEQSLSKGKQSSAKSSQQKGSQQMKDLSDKLQNAMDEYSEETLEEDIENLKHILKSLVQISFFQESIMNSTLSVNRRDPTYAKLLNNQNKVTTRFKVVEDSLQALSKRQVMIQPVVSRDIKQIKFSTEKINNYLEMGALAAARNEQQYMMQSVNNLALLLIEALQQMNEKQMEKQSSGKGSCKMKAKGGSKPGKPSAKTMRQLQEQLNQQMEQMMQQMKDGKPKQGNSQQMSEQFAKMAAMQEAIRQQLQDYKEMLMKEGLGEQKGLNEIMQQMENTERELINKRLNEQTLQRQKDIMVRLLESEKAEITKEKEEKRTSRTGKVMNNSNPETIFEYKRKKENTDEMIKFIPPVYNSFYRQKVNQFLNSLTE